MRITRTLLVLCAVSVAAFAQDLRASLMNLPEAKNYVLKRVSSYDRTAAMPTFERLRPLKH